MNNLEMLENAINHAGIECPSAKDVLFRIEREVGDVKEETVKMILDKYKEYTLSHNITNFGTQQKFIKTDKRLINLDGFVFHQIFRRTFPMPRTTMTEALFGDRDFFELYEKFKEIKSKIGDKRKKYEPIYKQLLNEAKNQRKDGTNTNKEGTSKV